MLQVHSFKDTRLKIKITENAENHDSSLVFKAVAFAKKTKQKTCGNSSDFLSFLFFLEIESKIVKGIHITIKINPKSIVLLLIYTLDQK